MNVDNMTEMVHKITMKAYETEEDFMFQIIQPFSEGIIQRKISKQELVNALLLYEKAKQLLGVENEV